MPPPVRGPTAVATSSPVAMAGGGAGGVSAGAGKRAGGGRLRVTLHGADGLRSCQAADVGGVDGGVEPTHPYAVVRLVGAPDVTAKPLHTGVCIGGGAAPTFGEALTFDVARGADVDAVAVEVYDAGAAAGANMPAPGTKPGKVGCMTNISRQLALLSVGEPIDVRPPGGAVRGGVGDRASVDGSELGNDNPLYENEDASARDDLCGRAVVPLSAVFKTWVSPAMRIRLDRGGEVTLSLLFVPCKREGYLYRERLKGGGWDRFWFALMADGRLCYFTKSTKMWNEQRGVVRLDEVTAVTPSTRCPSGVDPACCFELAGKDRKRGMAPRVYRLQAPDAAAGRLWLAELEAMHVLAVRPL